MVILNFITGSKYEHVREVHIVRTYVQSTDGKNLTFVETKIKFKILLI